jgi:hypothetical protein
MIAWPPTETVRFDPPDVATQLFAEFERPVDTTGGGVAVTSSPVIRNESLPDRYRRLTGGLYEGEWHDRTTPWTTSPAARGVVSISRLGGPFLFSLSGASNSPESWQAVAAVLCAGDLTDAVHHAACRLLDLVDRAEETNDPAARLIAYQVCDVVCRLVRHLPDPRPTRESASPQEAARLR